MSESRIKEASDFLSALHCIASPDTFVELRAIAPKWQIDRRWDERVQQRWTLNTAEDRRELADMIVRSDGAKLDAYVGVQPRKRDGGAETEDIACIVALYADVDRYKVTGNLIDRFDSVLPPSMIVDSGGGYHPYWLLDRPYLMDRFPEAQGIMDTIAARFGGDNVSDEPRILRLPGCINVKHKDRPVMARLVRCEPDRRFTLEQLAAVFPPSTKPRVVKKSAVAAGNVGDEPSLLERAFKHAGFLGSEAKKPSKKVGQRRYVRCPFGDGHTDGELPDGVIDTSAILTRPKESLGLGWFICLHDSCQKRFKNVEPKEIVKAVLAKLPAEAVAKAKAEQEAARLEIAAEFLKGLK